MKIINGKLIADKIKDQIAAEVFQLCSNAATRRPSLAIILVGARPDSELYVSLKQKAAAGVGIDTSLYKITEQADEAEILSCLNFLNTDPEIDGILIQLPLPGHLDTDKIVNTISPNKDVDGFTATSLKKIIDWIPSQDRNDKVIISPVFQAILACLKDAQCDLKNKIVAIIGKSGIFTQNLDLLLEKLGTRPLLITPEDIDNGQSATADIIISAVGQAELIKAEHIKENAILIDIGIAKNDENKTCGDIDAEDVESKAAWLTPVPGGIGPLTIAFALKNTLIFFKSKIQISNAKSNSKFK